MTYSRPLPGGIGPLQHSAKHSQEDVCERRVERLSVSDTGVVTRVPMRDRLVVEAPLELRIAGESLLVLMRTPGHDAELARGLMFAEGVIGPDEALAAMAEPADVPASQRGNILELGLADASGVSTRAAIASSSCGVCGKASIADLEIRADVLMSDLEVSANVIAGLPERSRTGQRAFALTGGLHAASAFDPTGRLLAIREDVGRHNAMDKLIGWALGSGRVPMQQTVVCVSGRVSFEIVQKAVVAGIPVVVAVSAPSSLAVDLAERFRVTLCGFNRDGRFNVYTHGTRIVDRA